MPELPEVETVRRGLEPVLLGARLAAVDVRRPDLRWPLPARMAQRLTGAQVTALTRRSKYILAGLDTGETWLIHLGMSGRITISGDAQGRFHREVLPLEKHDHVVLDTDAGVRIAYNDARRFGAMDLIETSALAAHKLIAAIGPEPLGNSFDALTLVGALKGRKTPIKSALLDQRTVAGLGNIYVCEALWRAGISPKRLAGDISRPRIEALVRAIKDVLTEAIAAGGSSLRDYRQADGELGYFQHGFAVYDRADEPCRSAGCTSTITRIVQSGRSSFYCEACQR